MTGPPLGRLIKNLEDELGILLLNRERNKRVTLTNAGKQYLKEAKEVMARVEYAAISAKEVAAGKVGELSIGFSDDFLRSFLLPFMVEFRKETPEINSHIYLQYVALIVSDVMSGKIDCGFIPLPSVMPLEYLNIRELSRTPIVAVVPESHKLANRDRIDLGALRDERFLLNPQLNRSAFDLATLQLYISSGFTPKRFIDVYSTAAQIELVANGHGVTLTTLGAIPRSISGCTYVRLTDSGAYLDRALIWSERNPNSVLPQFLDALENFPAAFDPDFET